MTAPLIYELVHKPTFTNQLLALPRHVIPQTLEKVELLRYSPEPDGKNKKRLKGSKDHLYRLRFGKYRIVYTFDKRQGWVALLCVDDRKDIYRDVKGLGKEATVSDISAVSSDGIFFTEDSEGNGTADHGVWIAADESSEDSSATLFDSPVLLPGPLDAEFLTKLRIPEKFFAELRGCRTVDDLIAARVPERIRNRVFDALLEPDFDFVLAQPSFIATSTDDFQRFVDGDLVHFLLQLDPEQERFVNWAIDGSGPALIKGSPGTGKTIIALYRVRSLIAALRRNGVNQPRLLLTAYTNTLVEWSRQLLVELLGPDAALVTICTADKLARDIVREADMLPKNILEDGGSRAQVMQAITRLKHGVQEDRRLYETIANLNLEYLRQEVDEVIVAREHSTLESYLAENRAGRGFRLTTTQRRALWRVHEEREAISKKAGLVSWSQLRRQAVELVRQGRGPAPFDGVLIDEAQDLEPTTLRLLIALCRTKDRLFLTADPNQSIHGSGFRWAQVHADLQFRGRTGILRRNYRSTREIMSAAGALVAGAELDPGEEALECPRSGPRPMVRVTQFRQTEIELIGEFLRNATRELRIGFGSCGILVPNSGAGLEIAKSLTHCGLPARYMEKKGIDVRAPEIKVITMHSAKGLEFPIVVIAGLSSNAPVQIPINATEDQIEETHQLRRRLLYVAMTRAMERLLVLIPADHPTFATTSFDPELWDARDVTSPMALALKRNSGCRHL